jgi:hypothetical protein
MLSFWALLTGVVPSEHPKIHQKPRTSSEIQIKKIKNKSLLI